MRFRAWPTPARRRTRNTSGSADDRHRIGILATDALTIVRDLGRLPERAAVRFRSASPGQGRRDDVEESVAEARLPRAALRPRARHRHLQVKAASHFRPARGAGRDRCAVR